MLRQDSFEGDAMKSNCFMNTACSGRKCGLLLVLALACSALTAGAEPIADGCLQIPLQPQPKWTFSGGWVDDGYGLVLADSGEKALRRYDLRSYLLDEGAVRGVRLSLKVPDVPEGAWPSFLKPASYGFLVEYHEGFMVKLDHELNVISAHSVVNMANGQGHYLASVVQWQPLGDNGLIGFGDVAQGSGNWVSAFVEVDFAVPRNFRVIESMSIYDDSRNFYSLGLPFIAVTEPAESDGEVIYVKMDRSPVIRAEDLNRSTMRDLDWAGSPFVNRRTLPERLDLSRVAALYEKIARSSIPVALLSWRSQTIVIDRRVAAPGTDSGTEWYLSTVGSTPGSEIRLPVFGAEHLSVIPGQRYWAFIEKGAVCGLAKQSISTLILVPSERISAALVSSGEGGGATLCEDGIRLDPQAAGAPTFLR